MFKSMKNFAADESGATAIEYALIASLTHLRHLERAGMG